MEEYLDIAQLKERVPYAEKKIHAMMTDGTWICGVHYNRPAGPRKKIIFFWSAIELWLKGEDFELRRRYLEKKSKKKQAGKVSVPLDQTPATSFEARRRVLMSMQVGK